MRRTAREYWFPFIALLAALPVAGLIALVQGRFAGQPERAIMATGAVLGALLLAGGGALVFRYHREKPYIPIAALTGIVVALLAIYLFSVSSAVFFPADILIWSESDFVNDILKFRIGYPIYTADVNNESFCYSFGTQLLTYALSAAVGLGSSIPAYRAVQVLFTLAAALLAMVCTKRIVARMVPDLRHRGLWMGLWAPALFLIATNPITNAYTHNLHNDALAQLLTVIAFYLLLVYAETRSARLLPWMAVLPAVAFLSKQSMAVWAGFFGVYLLCQRPFSWKRLIGFGAGAAAALAVVLGICFAIWGRLFYYWTFTVLGSHGISPLRSFQHAIDVWPFLAAGLFGGWAILRNGEQRVLLGPWLVWLVLILSEIYTSGVAWMLNHVGPGSLLAGVWFLAGLAYVWHDFERRGVSLLEPAVVACMVLLAFAGMGLIRIPLPLVPQDAHRYAKAIEKEFEGLPRDRVLLDAGTWMYWSESVVMKDRAPTIGERAYSQTGDFSGTLSRIRERRYSKILVRNFHDADFWYDHATWRRSSGIRQALTENYEETGKIAGVSDKETEVSSYLFTPISVLTPKTGAAVTAK